MDTRKSCEEFPTMPKIPEECFEFLRVLNALQLVMCSADPIAARNVLARGRDGQALPVKGGVE
jgi:hypothetical protein